jgi:hypothetical protein
MQPGLPVPSKPISHEALSDTVYMIENLSKEKAYEQAKAASDIRAYGAFHFGGVLLIIKQSEWYQDYGFSSFSEFVNDDFGISKSTAYDYMGIYHNLVKSGVSWEEIKHLGWTKIRLIAKYMSQGNLDEWIEIADSKNAMELRDFVRQSLGKKQDELISDPPKLSTQVETDKEGADLVSIGLAESIPVKVIYHLFPGQVVIVDEAVNLAMDEAGTAHKNVALEFICIHYLGSH